MARRVALLAVLLVAACAPPAASGDGGEGEGERNGEGEAEGGALGAACVCDADCAANDGHDGLCVAGVCFVAASGPCGAEGGTREQCPTGSRCWDLAENVPVCWADCDANACAGTCDSDGSCAPDDDSNVGCDDTCATVCLGGGAEPEPVEPVDLGSPPPPPTTSCANIPSFECTVAGGSLDEIEAFCGELVAFDPRQTTGYDDYAINGETAADQYRSFVRRDLMMLIQYATASAACVAQNWDFGDSVLGLGDMSEADGSIPGTSDGDPGHPPESHERGHDMDIGYYQLGQPNNRLREVCPHVVNGVDQLHCTGAPTILDPWRTAVFIAKAMDSPQYLTIGVDGQVAPVVRAAAQVLCDEGLLDAGSKACGPNGVARGPQNGFGTGISFDVSADEDIGWFSFHHHHLHISVFDKKGGFLPNW